MTPRISPRVAKSPSVTALLLRSCLFLPSRTMHPFGGTPKCPRCSNAVYAAEQVRQLAPRTIGSRSLMHPLWLG